MRSALAWLLLTVTSLYYLGGGFCFKIMYPAEIEYQMTAEERLIAEALGFEAGLGPKIKILEENQILRVAGGYSGVFVFSKELDGREVHYVIDPDPIQIIDREFLVGHPPSSDEQRDKATFFERLFSVFVIGEMADCSTWTPIEAVESTFSVSGLRDLCVISIPSPPPKRV